MAVKYVTEGFVFKREDRQEADRVFSVFTRDYGRIEVFGKSIRAITSKLKGGIEAFSFCQIEFIQGKNRKTLTDALFLKKYANIASDPEKFSVANAISQTLGHFIRGQEPDEGLLNFLADIFSKLNGKDANNKLLYYYFFWNFMAFSGYKPELSACAMCAQVLRPANLYFSNKEGGAICMLCAPKEPTARKINADTVKILRLVLKQEWDTLLKLKIQLESKKLFKKISDDYGNYLLSANIFNENR